VVEVYGEGVDAWLESNGRNLCKPRELHGETAFCYLREAAPAIENLRGHRHLRYMHRAATSRTCSSSSRGGRCAK
jgi:lipooligosaccharide transport system ATP-binding protein